MGSQGIQLHGKHRISLLQTGRSVDLVLRSPVMQKTPNHPAPPAAIHWNPLLLWPPLCTATWFHATKTQRTPDYQTTLLELIKFSAFKEFLPREEGAFGPPSLYSHLVPHYKDAEDTRPLYWS
ncbi:hypothetical protein GW7_10120 [Heterocephalus glaber]|uniref:Uncharacterized protein n=1 Tax=Heterocephalus glaber TaxID=10181 RepID=G5BAW8_HETGA|nr:hypothetical protein GW7_10120 [Heterocephalus glaber]